jgi:negative regulator of sigma E activity
VLESSEIANFVTKRRKWILTRAAAAAAAAAAVIMAHTTTKNKKKKKKMMMMIIITTMTMAKNATRIAVKTNMEATNVGKETIFKNSQPRYLVSAASYYCLC